MKAVGIGGLRAWITVFIGALFYCYQFIIRVSPNVMNDEILLAFGIDTFVFGLLISFYYWSYSILQIPLGILMDRFGPKYLIAAACCLCGVACFIFAGTTNFYIACFARLLMGTGAACGFLGSLKLNSMWVPPNRFATAIAVTYVLGTLGAAMGGRPLRALNEIIGWQSSINFLGVFGFLLALLVLCAVQKSPYSKAAQAKELSAIRKRKQGPFFGLILVAKRPQSWLIAAYGLLMYVPMTLIGDTWGVSFMVGTYDMDKKHASDFTFIMFLGAAIGSPIFAILSDFTRRRIQPMLIGALGAFTVYSIIIFAPNLPILLMYILFFLAGVCYAAKGLSFAATCEIVPRSQSGVAIGFNNMIVMISGIVFHPLVGYILNWSSKTVNGLPVHTAFDYRLSLAVIPISLAAAVIILKFIRETHPERFH